MHPYRCQQRTAGRIKPVQTMRCSLLNMLQAVQIMEANNIGNTYFLSKSLTERMLLNTSGLQGRLCIVRPSIVGAVAYEPCPGWVGNTSGFTALILGAASGKLLSALS